jgi:hypothetical protein
MTRSIIASTPIIANKGKNMSKISIMVQKKEVRKVWNYILPENHTQLSYNPIQSIPVLAKQNYSRKPLRRHKRQTKNQ